MHADCAKAEPQVVVVDCANGVGAMAAAEAAGAVERAGLTFRLMNDAALDESRRGAPLGLNERCGSDHVQNTRSWPFPVASSSGQLACSFDGDADRIVFYFAPERDAQPPAPRAGSGSAQRCESEQIEPLVLLDGDYIAALLALHLQQVLQRCKLAEELTIGERSSCALASATTEQYDRLHEL